MPPWRGRGRPRKMLVDDEVIFASHAPPLQDDPLVHLVPPVGPFPPISPKAF